ncbi:UPF0149 family protein [Gammaproteobacteria bacterium]|nr:UPF0149 family protein [Gammaproteobacteria bacterium]
MTEDKKVLEISRILTEWNPLGARSATVEELNDYETEAQDILWAMNLHGGTVKKAVTMVLQQAFNIELDDFELECYSKRIASTLDDQVEHRFHNNYSETAHPSPVKLPMPQPDPEALTDENYDFLESVLDSLESEDAMNLEMVDGFFVALICAPQLVMPSQYMPEVLGGEDEAYESLEQAERFMTVLMAHWNHIARTLQKDDIYLPILLEDSNGVALGNDWAKGFLRGMDFHPADWVELLDDEEHGGAMVAILALAHEHDPDPEMRPYKEPIDEERREDLLLGLAAGTQMVYDYFEPYRKMEARVKGAEKTFRRESPKIGRNAPCPCGSGKKYKQCCGKTILH